MFVQTDEKKTKGVTATATNYQVGAYGEDGATLSLEKCSESMRENRSFRKGNSNYLYGGKKKQLHSEHGEILERVAWRGC